MSIPGTSQSTAVYPLSSPVSALVVTSQAVFYDITVPRTAAVQVTADAGKIVLSGLAGQVIAKAHAGIITATGLTSAFVSLTTDVGAITADFAAPPASVAAATRLGAITLRVPAAATYDVTATASFGQANVRIPQTPLASHVITATTDVGAILVAYLDSGAPQSS